ncbi:4-diphosphocytidyl-2-C-methyl-D-erythritol kinase [Bacteroidia bacterium]|nr:4-diphosphocytidyl-2-C-methyl-D-erythritol kinase [Bacteroidia bacterium]
MLTFPNAKINIGLNVTERRADGYHNIETVFYPISLCDILEVVPSQRAADYTFHASGIAIDADAGNNLITKAYRLLKADFDIPPIEVFFRKIIPFGAGLGGGSADAAFMLKMLNEVFDLRLSIPQLENYAARLGADCAVFIQNKAVFASGIGNVFQDINISLRRYYIALVKPDVYVSTKDAYAGIVPKKPRYDLRQIVENTPVAEWKNYIENDFEKTVFQKFPVIEKIKNELYAQGAIYAAMSGSGSAVFGIFEWETELKDVFADCFVWENYF